MSSQLKEFAKDVWLIEKEFAVGGLEIGSRSVLIRLKSGELWMHSPVDMNRETIEEIKALGKLKYVVAPSVWHHLFLKNADDNFEDVKLIGPKELFKKRKELSFSSSLCTDCGFIDEIEVRAVNGMPAVNEFAFYHKESKLLIVTDLIFNLKNVKGIWASLLTNIFGTKNKLAVSRLFKTQIKDLNAFKSSIEEISRWDFDKLSMAHGEAIDSRAKTQYLKLMSDYL